MPTRHLAQDTIDQAVTRDGADGVIAALTRAGYHLVETDVLFGLVKQAETFHANSTPSQPVPQPVSQAVPQAAMPTETPRSGARSNTRDASTRGAALSVPGDASLDAASESFPFRNNERYSSRLSDIVEERIWRNRVQVHELYEPLVAEAKIVRDDPTSPPVLSGFARRLLDLIGSRS